jgi:hypothetical protein
MIRALRMSLWLLWTLLLAALVFCGREWYRAQREAAAFHEALDELGVKCVRTDGALLCVTSHGEAFAVGFQQPVRSEGDEQ